MDSAKKNLAMSWHEVTKKVIKAASKLCVHVKRYTVYEWHYAQVSEMVFKAVEQPSTLSLI